MPDSDAFTALRKKYLTPGDHAKSDYFAWLRELLRLAHAGTSEKNGDAARARAEIDAVYELVRAEMLANAGPPVAPVSFGTSGWRGILGKDLYVKSVAQVTLAIVSLYLDLESSLELAPALGVGSLAQARRRGCVLGFDNRFGGELLARAAMDTLTGHGFTVHYAGEATTGTLSAAVLKLGAAFSINLTPSHNPLDYGGFKYNAADAGPAAPELTNRITERARAIIAADAPLSHAPEPSLARPVDALALWKQLVLANRGRHCLDYEAIMAEFARRDDLVVVVDCVHGASRGHIRSLFKNIASDRLVILRGEADPTFGGIAPEPSSANLKTAQDLLNARSEPLKLGAIIDPDADRIRFTDGALQISMNHFGAMSYHHLHEHKKLPGMVAKTVATSNFANALAAAFGERTFEPRVGFKEFKPVIHEALVCFEESDGITVIGHTPEKDAYIGLLLALDMVQSRNRNLSDYLRDIETRYGAYFPARDGIAVSQAGARLKETLAGLESYGVGSLVRVGSEEKRIKEVIAIDGRKMIFEDASWIMIRPSGTEPKVRFYVEARTEEGKEALFAAAQKMLADIGLL